MWNTVFFCSPFQVKSLQGQEMSATIAHYDYELHKVKMSSTSVHLNVISFAKEFGFWIVGRRNSCQEYLSYVMSFSVWSSIKATILLYFVSLTPEPVASSAECKSDGFGDNSTLVDQEFIRSIYSHAGKSFARGREGSASDGAGMQFCNFP
jgi:hypothetical protein